MDGSGAERYNNDVVKPSDASMAETTGDAEHVMANIRELNEQMLQAAPFGGPRVPATPTSGRCGRSPMKAQANFTRDVVSAVSEVSRSRLKKLRPSSGR